MNFPLHCSWELVANGEQAVARWTASADERALIFNDGDDERGRETADKE